MRVVRCSAASLVVLGGAISIAAWETRGGGVAAGTFFVPRNLAAPGNDENDDELPNVIGLLQGGNNNAAWGRTPRAVLGVAPAAAAADDADADAAARDHPGAPSSAPSGGGPPAVVTYGRIPTHPKCPSTCLQAWLGDGWCDTACSVPECGNDDGDCEGWCSPDCKESWIGDGFCDVDCFKEECRYDGGDCDGKYKKEALTFPLKSHAEFDYKGCPEFCAGKLHNGECDSECNRFECNFDGEDCYHQCAGSCANVWLGDGECDEGCDSDVCHHDKGDCKPCADGCHPHMIGNGVCDPACRNRSCHHDAGDCYDVCWTANVIDYIEEPFFYPHCRNEWRGDGFCDCFCLNEECSHDFQDCDGVDCSLELERLHQLEVRMGDRNISRYFKDNKLY